MAMRPLAQGMTQRGHTNVDAFKDEGPSQVQNNFTAGLKTEFTGMNFPTNACTETDNVIFTMVGDIVRREGFDYENGFVYTNLDRTGAAISSHHWLNAGGDGETQVVAIQVGKKIYFYESSASTTTNGLSTTILPAVVDMTAFAINSQDPTGVEAQFADGNGYLFVYHPMCNPFYCTFNNGTITPTEIDIKIRDFLGYYPEPGNPPLTTRPITLSSEHLYNLENQGWSNGTEWSVSSTLPDINILMTNIPTTVTTVNGVHAANEILSSQQVYWFDPAGYSPKLGNVTFTVQAGVTGITIGQIVDVSWKSGLWGFYLVQDVQYHTNNNLGGTATGTVVSYSGTTLVINITSVDPILVGSSNDYEFQFAQNTQFTISSNPSIDTIGVWHQQIGNYPSNADIWWDYMSVETTSTISGSTTTSNATEVFDPKSTINSVGLPNSPAPRGHFVLDAFNQQQGTASNITGLTPIVTNARPRTGTWFAGRVWFAGVDASQQATGDLGFYTWTENLYFSQIITDQSMFGNCYQKDDPTDRFFFDLLPDDGGVITIQGAGSIQKLFPIQNGMLVFASNGIWFITGSTGIGFTASDYTVTKISAVRSIGHSSYVDVNGLPVFWNEEAIYAIAPSQSGGLQVEPLTVKTIKSLYSAIPRVSKKYAKGAYHPLDYIIEWIYRSAVEESVTSRYEYDSVLVFNVATQAFYTYSLPEGPGPFIHDILYISNPGDLDSEEPVFKYFTSALQDVGVYNTTFSEENNTSLLDWFQFDGTGVNYNSYFVTGHNLSGQGLRLFQPGYVSVYSRTPQCEAYNIQGIWNFAARGSSGKYSSKQLAVLDDPNFGMAHKRHRIRGHGTSIQLKFSSHENCPFDIMGWSIWETQNTGV